MFHFGSSRGAELEDVGHEAHRRPGREDVGAAGDVLLEDVVLGRAADPCPLDALRLGRGDVQGQQDRRRGVDRHRRADLAERQAVEQDGHVGEAARSGRRPARPPRRRRRVRVVAHLGRQVEGHRQAGLALLEQVAEAPVGLLGGGEAGVLAHRPEAAAVHRRLDAPGERELAGPAEVARPRRGRRCRPACTGRGSRCPTRSRSARAARRRRPSALARSVARQRSRAGSLPSPTGSRPVVARRLIRARPARRRPRRSPRRRPRPAGPSPLVAPAARSASSSPPRPGAV